MFSRFIYLRPWYNAEKASLHKALDENATLMASLKSVSETSDVKQRELNRLTRQNISLSEERNLNGAQITQLTQNCATKRDEIDRQKSEISRLSRESESWKQHYRQSKISSDAYSLGLRQNRQKVYDLEDRLETEQVTLYICVRVHHMEDCQT